MSESVRIYAQKASVDMHNGLSLYDCEHGSQNPPMRESKFDELIREEEETGPTFFFNRLSWDEFKPEKFLGHLYSE